jgi:hypothetical protein
MGKAVFLCSFRSSCGSFGGLGKACSGVLRKGFHPLRQTISPAVQNLTQSYDYLFNGLNGQQSFSTLARTQGFFSPILKGKAIRKRYICKQKVPVAEQLLTKKKAPFVK